MKTNPVTMLEHVEAGWEIVGYIPGGTVMKSPRRMTGLGIGAIAVGATAALWSLAIGGFIIGCAMVDYAFLNKRETKIIQA